jgi:hypothetical protein
VSKVYLLCVIFIWIRGTLPRLRADQLMQFAWFILIPATLGNILLTDLIFLGVSGLGLSDLVFLIVTGESTGFCSSASSVWWVAPLLPPHVERRLPLFTLARVKRLPCK